MTPPRPLADADGDFQPWNEAKQECRKCGSPRVKVRVWESKDGAYEDYQYRCECGAVWWVDGIDS